MKVLCQLSIFLLTWQGHLNASTLSQAFLRPIALITDADNALHNPPDNRAARDKDLLDSVVSTLRKGGLSLLPSLLSSMAHSLVPVRLSEAAWFYWCVALETPPSCTARASGPSCAAGVMSLRVDAADRTP